MCHNSNHDVHIRLCFTIEQSMFFFKIFTEQYDCIIYKAINNHNKFEIERGLSERELLHCKIIRDADKLDIFRVKEEDSFENMCLYHLISL